MYVIDQRTIVVVHVPCTGSRFDCLQYSFHQPQNFCSCRLPKRVVFARQSLTEFEEYKTSNTAGVSLGARLNILVTYCNLGIFRFGFFWVHWTVNFRGLWYFVGNKSATVFTKHCKIHRKKVRFCPWRSNLRRQLPLNFRQHLGYTVVVPQG